tara:strand:- start:1079 stop:1378 length:300 start_codon:yes stop_codon:yes gene_type:complete
MENIIPLLHQGVALAKTPAQRAKVEHYFNAFGKRLARCNALLDEGDKNLKDLEDIRNQTNEIRECTKLGILWTGKPAIRRSINPAYVWSEDGQAWIKKA